VPFGEREYYSARPTIAIPRPGSGDRAAIDLDGFFAFHPRLAPLQQLYARGQLAIIHACGSHDRTRSHFDAQDYMESGTPGVKSTSDGWLNRYLQVRREEERAASDGAPSRGWGPAPLIEERAATEGAPSRGRQERSPAPLIEQMSSFRAVSLTNQLPRTLQGKAPALAINQIGRFGIRGDGMASSSFEAQYEAASDAVLGGTGREAFDAIKTLKTAAPERYQPANGAQYPRTPYGQALMQIGQLIKADIGLEVAFAESDGWDHHVNEGASTGQIATRLDDFARGLSALVTDLGDRMEDVVILTMSEFGRAVAENGNRGTDHGHGNAMMAIGGAVRGGKVYGKWPGLAVDQRFERRDLAVTTDFRDVFGEVVVRHLNVANPAPIFPGYAIKPANFPGLFG
jgi:uncharacterized protein (DUF1501 family)